MWDTCKKHLVNWCRTIVKHTFSPLGPAGPCGRGKDKWRQMVKIYHPSGKQHVSENGTSRHFIKCQATALCFNRSWRHFTVGRYYALTQHLSRIVFKIDCLCEMKVEGYFHRNHKTNWWSECIAQSKAVFEPSPLSRWWLLPLFSMADKPICYPTFGWIGDGSNNGLTNELLIGISINCAQLMIS